MQICKIQENDLKSYFYKFAKSKVFNFKGW